MSLLGIALLALYGYVLFDILTTVIEKQQKRGDQ